MCVCMCVCMPACLPERPVQSEVEEEPEDRPDGGGGRLPHAQNEGIHTQHHQEDRLVAQRHGLLGGREGYMYVCMNVWMCGGMYVWIYVWRDVCMAVSYTHLTLPTKA